MEIHQDVTIAGDIMFVNKIAFFMTVSRSLKFGTVKMIQNRKSKSLLTAIENVKSLYTKRGIRFHTMLMDNEFENLRGELEEMNIHMNVVSKGEHVPEIERYQPDS
jgi:hypothetical protein